MIFNKKKNSEVQEFIFEKESNIHDFKINTSKVWYFEKQVDGSYRKIDKFKASIYIRSVSLDIIPTCSALGNTEAEAIIEVINEFCKTSE